MSRRRLLGWVGVFVSGGLALLGFILFLIGVLAEFVANRTQPLPDDLSPTMQVALAGLCLAALMIVLGFALVGVLLARQTRQQAPGYGDAYRLIERLQFGQAIPLLERAIDNGRETPDLLMLLTSAYAYNGQIAKAQATADRAIQLFPDDPSAYITLANGYRWQASYDEAARALQAATELAPDQPVVWAELGFVYQLAGDSEAAMSAFKKAAAIPMPAMYGVRVYYHLMQGYKLSGDTEGTARTTAKMMSARNGLDGWQPVQRALEGTVYGQSLRYEIANIAQAIDEADAGNLG